MKAAAALTRFLLLFYPRTFRREVGAAVIADVGRRGAELAIRHGRVRAAAWLVPLALSLILNGAAAWWERLIPRRTSFSWLDIKLALRMLIKYPGLSLTGGLGIAVAIAIGVGFISFTEWQLHPDIPLHEGHRMVGLENWDRRTTREARRSLHDYAVWRTGMTAVEDLSVFQTVSRNIVGADGTVEPVRVAEMTPSGFRLARVPPLLGRTLLDADATPGAAPVVVIGFEVWRTRFLFAPDVVGRDLRLGQDLHTIVGVMPDGFAFPVNHRIWTPLKLNPADFAPGEGPPVFICGRLATGFELDDARAELDVIGTRMAAAYPSTHAHLRPEVLPYAYQFAGMNRHSADAAIPMIVVFSLLLIVVCVNVAVLVYARTTARRGEMAVRSALGASRGRIVGQMFAESLVLCAGAAGIAIFFVQAALAWMTRAHRMPPFWTKYELSATAIAYGITLAFVAAIITGVVPALQATGRRMQAHLQQMNARASLSLGRTWTALIVIQIAVAVAAVPIAIALTWSQIRGEFRAPAFAVDQVVVALVALDETLLAKPDAPARFAVLRGDLSRRLQSEIGIVRHGFSMDLPASGVSIRVDVENDAEATAAKTRREVVRSTVDDDFFQTLDLTLLAGRTFLSGDGDTGNDGVIVNRGFATQRIPEGNPLGRRIRYVVEHPAAVSAEERNRWYEIIGVVEDIDTNPFHDALTAPRVYHPLRDATRANLVVRMDTIPPGTAERLRQLTAHVSPALVVDDVITFAEVHRLRRTGIVTVSIAVLVGLGSVLLLSAAGIYALMSFTVTQRRREIAIRTALGAQPGRLLGDIFRRSLKQISIGVALGVGIAILLNAMEDGEALQGYGAILLLGMVLVMSLVGLLAALGPARRGLRVDPIEALRLE